ncbi:MAG: hypothetical protein KatS3mg121_0125 [Gammaproteobacteria bacterium]|nr:MAG: hypothetical protein KatS3mg121_0125 [Gammaproteobacteria bacterium]
MGETSFTPGAALLGGAAIGAAAVLLMFTRGRVLGASGLVAGVLFPATRAEAAWRAVLLLAAVLALPLWTWVSGTAPPIEAPQSPGRLVLGGLLVGLGVSWGGGCPSGHGVCGLARAALRSLVAVAVFLSSAVLTVTVTRHVFGG